MKRIILLCCILMQYLFLSAQTVTTIASGFTRPIGVSTGFQGEFLVADAGTGNDDGKVYFVTSTLVNVIVDSLPSYLDTATGEVSGPWRAYAASNGLLRVIVGGGVSPYAGSILTFDTAGFIPGAPLTPPMAINVLSIQNWAISNGFLESNPFSAVWDSLGNVFVADAAANAIFKIDSTGLFSVFDTFPDIPNIVTPFPPTIDYVPTRLIGSSTDGFYLCNLTGFPFLGTLSSIIMIDSTGANTLVEDSLTQAVDMFRNDNTGEIYVLQFGTYDSNFVPIPNSALIIRIQSNGLRDTLYSNFGPSAGMCMDSGAIYVTTMFTGNLLKIDFSTGIKNIPGADFKLIVYPNPVNNTSEVRFTLDKYANVTYRINDRLGRLISSEDIGKLGAGNHTVKLSSVLADISPGVYVFTLMSDDKSQSVYLTK
jgi:hypothetical protein